MAEKTISDFLWELWSQVEYDAALCHDEAGIQTYSFNHFDLYLEFKTSEYDLIEDVITAELGSAWATTEKVYFPGIQRLTVNQLEKYLKEVPLPTAEAVT